MNSKFICFVLAFFLLAGSAFAGKWMIDSFDESSDPGEADNYIAGEFGGELKPVKPGQVSAQSGRLYVRQKFEDPFEAGDAVYQIYQGKTTGSTQNLGKISIDGISYSTLLKMKVFYKKSSSGDDDIETIYFDGKDILVEGEDPVYMNLNGKWEEFKPMVSREYKVSITSIPAGATVVVGGAEKGKTPATFGVGSSKTVAVVVSMDGYYTTIKPVTPSEKQTVQEGVNLVAKPPLENPATDYRAKMKTASASKDASALKSLKADIQKSLNNFTADTKKRVDAIMLKFPANPPKTASESATDYSARQTIWTNTQSRERDAMNKQAQEHFNELKDLLAELDASAGDMDFTLKYEYIPNSAITFSNMGIKDFTVGASLENSRVNFKYSSAKLAYGNIPRNDIVEDQDNVHGVLKIWDVPNENGKYSSIYDVAFFYDETPLKMLTKGTFSSGDATPSSRNTERDLNTRILKNPKKAAWDKKDEAATLAALKAGEIPDATSVASKSKAKEDAYYDEEEDEDEYENSRGEQEEQDYSRYGASQSASDIFGSSDEILFWTSMAFFAAAIGTGVVGTLQTMKYMEANDALSGAKEQEGNVINAIKAECAKAENNLQQACVDNAKQNSEQLAYIKGKMVPNEKAKDEYKQGFIIWYSAAAVSLAVGITLFVW
ncbi:MAG: PEGA domain-containing protein [Fibromonadaceae bacterium]|jgi:hypothetical protein|nr:PEGA domain-containing protein [Fibromonadaceae bacterium]